MENDLPVGIEDAEVHGVKIDVAVMGVLSCVESHGALLVGSMVTLRVPASREPSGGAFISINERRKHAVLYSDFRHDPVFGRDGELCLVSVLNRHAAVHGLERACRMATSGCSRED